MTSEIVKAAKVEVINIQELRIGDSILWGRQKIRIIKIDYQNKVVTAAHPVGELRPVYAYYRILSCVKERPNTVCPGCGTVIASFSDYPEEFCTTTCKDKYEEYIKNEYR